MGLLPFLEILNYCLVLFYGLFLSVGISGSWENRRQKQMIILLYPVLLLIQCLFWLSSGTGFVRALYPLITHLPLVLILIFILKKKVGVAFVSVFTAYLCCQLPRWLSLLISALTHSALVEAFSYSLSVIVCFLLLQRWFVRPAHSAMTYSPQSLLLFGSLPLFYYCFDYATAVYSDALYVGIQALNEFLPTALIIFYVMFLTTYHVQAQNRAQAELHQSILESELKQSELEIENLRYIETQTAIYQHDMRHHLAVIDGFLSTNNLEQAQEYIQGLQTYVQSITAKHYCENKLADLLCSSFATKAARAKVKLSIHCKLPGELPIPDTEFSSVLSNGLENAIQAVSALEEQDRWVNFYSVIKMNKLLLEIQNPYSGEILLQDGLPVSHRDGHGYGCRSIQTIIQRNGGICSFNVKNGLFSLRIILPMVRTT